jgi:23S rRNA pseudouridine2605 synthase
MTELPNSKAHRETTPDEGSNPNGADRATTESVFPLAGERLQKVLAAAGFGSRRACEELITTGRVTVDGQTVTELGMKVNLDRQKVLLDGERIRAQQKKYYVLNKPRGCVCTNHDPAGRQRAIDLVPAADTRLFSVGRLDESTDGLLLLTNDGELAHRLAHPRFQVERVYRVQVAGIPNGEAMRTLEEGMYFTEGKFRMRQVRRLKTKGQSTLLEVTLTEGHNREVRRLFARLGHKVMSLSRVRFGPVKLGSLVTGEFRPLRGEELSELQAFVRGGGRYRRGQQKSREGAAASSQRPGRRPTSKSADSRGPSSRRTPSPAGASAGPPDGDGPPTRLRRLGTSATRPPGKPARPGEGRPPRSRLSKAPLASGDSGEAVPRRLPRRDDAPANLEGRRGGRPTGATAGGAGLSAAAGRPRGTGMSLKRPGRTLAGGRKRLEKPAGAVPSSGRAAGADRTVGTDRPSVKGKITTRAVGRVKPVGKKSGGGGGKKRVKTPRRRTDRS